MSVLALPRMCTVQYVGRAGCLGILDSRANILLDPDEMIYLRFLKKRMEKNINTVGEDSLV